MSAPRIALSLVALIVLAGCASGVATQTPLVAEQPAPFVVEPEVAQMTPSADLPPDVPEGRVIKVIRLPKGQTPYDLPR